MKMEEGKVGRVARRESEQDCSTPGFQAGTSRRTVLLLCVRVGARGATRPTDALHAGVAVGEGESRYSGLRPAIIRFGSGER
jgi:hypothetical protein